MPDTRRLSPRLAVTGISTRAVRRTGGAGTNLEMGDVLRSDCNQR
jgi:hypothetical protein